MIIKLNDKNKYRKWHKKFVIFRIDLANDRIFLLESVWRKLRYDHFMWEWVWEYSTNKEDTEDNNL
jgi:hypothetical protein